MYIFTDERVKGENSEFSWCSAATRVLKFPHREKRQAVSYMICGMDWLDMEGRKENEMHFR